ncbi:MAG: hypothetical protein A2Z38_01970 [Planctomycetes bacterium RBG_19FT_COMBO_48_8]|nr:MAG: hypothetical protein A2Z38_01970 [Planctomycetes bacterium RBG_19FT_COMBO_48_8]
MIELTERIWYFNNIKALQRTALPPVVLGMVISHWMWNLSLSKVFVFATRCRRDMFTPVEPYAAMTIIGGADTVHSERIRLF